MFVRLPDLGPAQCGADLVVVGSGPAGLSLALAARRHGARVLLLESGGARAGDHPSNDAVISALPFTGARAGRARGFGGTGEKWAGMCQPLDDVDLAERPWVAGSGWPIEIDELAAWVRRAAALYQVDGATYDGRDVCGAAVELPAFDPAVLRWRTPTHSPGRRLGTRSRRRCAKDPELTVALDATAVRVLVDGDRATGVVARSMSGAEKVVLAGTTVLACGGLENARLLLDAGEPLHGLPALGQGLHSHPYWMVGTVAGAPPEIGQVFQSLVVRGRRIRPKLALAPEEQRRRETLNCIAELELDHGPRSAVGALKRLRAAAHQRTFPPGLLGEITTLARDPVAVVREAAYRRRGVGSPPDRFTPVLLRVQTEQPPLGPSRVILSDRRDHFGARQLDIAWTVGEQERHTCRQMADVVRTELAAHGLGQVELVGWLDDPDRFRTEAGECFHHAGTTRMSRDPRDGVVDTDCRVHGLDGLYVVGGSVFPTSGYTHPTLTIVALALRLAQHLTGGPASRG